ncbi:MAG: PAS-domain containing protein [Rubrivivax sp.]|nr:PAS-domain containing protein [Rubrivivax sp.]
MAATETTANVAVAGAPAARIEAALRAERVRLYRAGKWSAIAGQSIIAALVLWVVHEHVPPGALWLWAALVGASFLARISCERGRHADAETHADGGAHTSADPAWAAELLRTRAAVLGMGLALGLASVLAFPIGQFQSQVFLAFMMAGLAAGALTLTSFDLRIAMGYAVIVLGPLIARLVASGEPTAMATGVAGGLFALFLALNGQRAQRNMRQMVAVREAGAQRAESLLESQGRLEQATAELRRTSEDLRLTFEHMDQGIFCLGPDGHTSFFNRRMCELTGLPESFMSTRPTGQEITRYQQEHGHFDADQQLMEVEVRERIQQWRDGVQAPVPPQYFRRTHLGTVLDVKTAPLPGGGFVRTFADVTALVDANQRLRDSEAQQRKLALVAAHTDDAVVITDAERRIEWVNAAFTRLSGYTLAEVLGRRTAELLRGPLTDAAAAARIDEELNRTQKASGEILHYRKDGSSYWFALQTHAVRAEDGMALQYIGVGRDVTARRAADEALRAARDEAERASRAKSDFLSAMSHELRTPMNAILGFAQLLEADPLDPLPARQREQVRQVREAGTHLLALINDVLDLARVEAGREAIALAPVALPPLVEECLELMRPLARERGVELPAQAALAFASPPAAMADRTRLKQVLLNLLGNAIKYNAAGGRVRVRILVDDAVAVGIEVSDTGPGLPEAAMRRLFTAFERLGAERGPVEGAGIGLALSRRLVELMRGTIGARSTPGEGSTFTVTLPREGAAAQADAPPAGAPAAGQAGTAGEGLPGAAGTVLYIEDNAVNVVLMQAMLQPMAGVELLVAEQPEPGLALARERRPDLILVDIQLPGIDGYEVLRRLRADARTCAAPVIAISANAMRGDIERGLAAGFDDYLTKPLDVVLLRAAVSERLAAARRASRGAVQGTGQGATRP